MKNGIWMLISGLIGTLLLAIVMAIWGNTNRSIELQENLSTVMEGALRESICQEESENKKLVADCIAGLAVVLDSTSDLRLDVYQVDEEKGIIALATGSNYTHSNGVDGETEWQRVVICDKKKGTESVEYCEVQFYKSKDELLQELNLYKKISVLSGECIIAPRAPYKVDAEFVEWRDANDYIADFSQGVSENRAYYAVWK